MTIEETFLRTFVVPEKRARYVELLAKPAKRDKILDRLNHSFDFDGTYASLVPGGADVAAMLESKGAPATCHVIADGHDLDGCAVSLREAIAELSIQFFGYVIICIPDRLALYRPEAPSDAYVLEIVDDV